MRRSFIQGLVAAFILLTVLAVGQAAATQQTEPHCDLEAVIHHQNEHAQELANFAAEAEADLDAALAKLYRTAIAYQALAAECGFANGAAVEATHQAEHAGDEAHAHGAGEAADILATAHSIGDPENGKLLFNTVQTEVSFACATCHRVDSTETLVGPGLLGIGEGMHDHGAATPAPNGSHDSMGGMHMGEATPEVTAAPEQTTEEIITFIRTSVVNPSAFVMTGFPDNLMPKVYGQIFTEQEVNDIVAYLFTLR